MYARIIIISHFCVKDYLSYRRLYKYIIYYFINLPCSKKRKHDTNKKLIKFYYIHLILFLIMNMCMKSCFKTKEINLMYYYLDIFN